MPVYEYKGFAQDGRQSRGIIEADTAKTARQKLKKMGLMVSSIQEKQAASQKAQEAIPFIGGKVSASDVALATRQLASLVKANIPLVDALSALLDQSEQPQLKAVLSQIRQDVNEGASLARALGKHPKVFDNIYINMVEAGEASGTLGLVLLKLADLKESQMRLLSKIRSASTYPVLMMAVSSVMMIVIFTVVIPKITKVFESSKKPLPAMTKLMMTISEIVTDWWYILIIAMIFGVISLLRYIKTEKGLLVWDRFRLNVRIFGPIVRMIAITRFASTLATLLASGVPIVAALNIAKNLVGNIHIANAIAQARENITEGQSIAEPLRRSGEFPPMVIHMISIGEKTGELPDMLRNIAETYEEQVNTKIEGMTSLVEPVMIIGMGVVVGIIVFSVFMPIMEMSDIR